MLPVRQRFETRALTPMGRLGRPLGKLDKDATSVAYRSSIDGIADRPARERLRTQYGAAQRTS